MQSFLHSIQAVLLILLLTATGYFISWKGWLTSDAKQFISRLMMGLCVPITCIYSLRMHLTIDILRSSKTMLLVPFFSVGIGFLLSIPVGKLLHLPRKSFGVFMMLCALSNTLFIGLPMCTELFGDESIPYTMGYYIISTCFTNLIGYSLISWSGDSGGFSSKQVIRLVTSPSVIGVIIGVVVVLADIQIPSLLMNYMKYLNQLATPLALLVTGRIIYEIGIKNLKFTPPIVAVVVFRFIISTALCIFFCNVFGVQGLAKNVFIVQASMPVVSSTTVAAANAGADDQLAAQCAAITTILTFIVIPVLMMVLH